MKKTAKALVDEAMGRVTTYTVAQAREMHGQPGVQFVDVRDVRELEQEGAIPGAFHVPRGMLEFGPTPSRPTTGPSSRRTRSTCSFAGWAGSRRWPRKR